jgi:hypothetical protein
MKDRKIHLLGKQIGLFVGLEMDQIDESSPSKCPNWGVAHHGNTPIKDCETVDGAG